MNWRLIEEYNALCNDLEALNEKIMVLLDRKEESINYENSVGYVMKTNGGYEIRLNRSAYSIAIGKTQSLDGAKRFLDRCESNPKNIEKLIGK